MRDASLKNQCLALLRVAALILCLAGSVLACVHQFSHDHLLPILLAVVFLLPIRWLRPSWFRWTLILPAAALALLLVDAFAMRHRLAVGMRAWNPLYETDHVEDRLLSPSGRTAAYVVGSHWIDSAYRVYVSHGRLFPSAGGIETEKADPAYPRNIFVQWRGSLLVAGAGEDDLSLGFDESSGRLYTYADWARGGVRPGAHATRAEFTKFLRGIEQGE